MNNQSVEKFAIEMPKSGPSIGERIVLSVCAAALFASSVFGMVQLVTDGSSPAWLKVTTIAFSVLLLVLGGALFLLTLRARKLGRVADQLAEGIQSHGMIPLEPITVTHRSFRVLLRDSVGAALWNVSLHGRTINLTKV